MRSTKILCFFCLLSYRIHLLSSFTHLGVLKLHFMLSLSHPQPNLTFSERRNWLSTPKFSLQHALPFSLLIWIKKAFACFHTLRTKENIGRHIPGLQVLSSSPRQFHLNFEREQLNTLISLDPIFLLINTYFCIKY